MSEADLSRIIQHVQQKLHTNLYEHHHLMAFYKACLLSGFFGLLLGAAIEESIKFIENHTDLKPRSRLQCGALLWIHLSVIAFVLYFGNSAPIVRKYMYFDDWLMGTFAGFLFALCFINIQNSLNTNMTCVVNGPAF